MLFACRRNQITTFPSELCSLPLQVLNLSNNKLSSLPVEIGHLTLLQDLVSIVISYLSMCCFRKYPYPSCRKSFSLNPPPPPLWKFHSIPVSYFPSKNRALETPLPLGISVNLPWGGHGHFLELHNLNLLK